MSYSAPVSSIAATPPACRRLSDAHPPGDDDEADTDADMMMAEQEMKCEAGVMLSWSACDSRRP